MFTLEELNESINLDETLTTLVNDIVYDFVAKEEMLGNDYKEVINFIAMISLETNLNLVLTRDDYKRLWVTIRNEHTVVSLVFKLINTLTQVLGKDAVNDIINNIYHSNITVGVDSGSNVIVSTDSDLIETIKDYKLTGLKLLNDNKWIIPLHYINSSLLETLKVTRS